MPRTTAPKPIRFLDVNFSNAYGQKEIIVHVSCDLPGEDITYRESSYWTSRPKGPFSGAALEDLRLTAYVGHYSYGASYADPMPQDKVWGWGWEFKPSRIQHAYEAERILRTLKALGRAGERLRQTDEHRHADGCFDGWLRLVAAAVGATEIRIWQPQAGNVRAHLSAPLPLDTGAELVVAIAGAWGRAGYVSSDAIINRTLAIEAQLAGPALPESPSPLRLGRDDVLRCLVCKQSGLDDQYGDERHRKDSPSCYSPEALASVA